MIFMMRYKSKLLYIAQLWLLTVLLGSPAYAASIASGREVHVLNRLTLGPRPDDLERVQSMGVDRFIQEQLSPSSIPIPESLKTKLAGLKTLGLRAPDLFLEYGPPSYEGKRDDPQAAQKARQRARIILDDAIDARLMRAIESPRQLEEVMVDFWFNHFNVFSQKGLDNLWIGSYEEQAIRPYVFGRFRDLLGATAKHPAMLFYLDNWQNTAPDSPGARGQFKGLNENYARELMELHTLGVNGGYTQTDVITLAKILTGWGFRRPRQSLQPAKPFQRSVSSRQPGTDENGFFFDANRHDFSPKVFLGRPIRGSGLAEGEEALDILAQHPSTARFISYKLAQYFISDNPPEELVERLAKRFLETRGDIRAVLEQLFHSAEFWDEQHVGKKFKTPYEYVVSAVRAAGVSVSNTRPLRGTTGLLGMPLYGCLTPDGYKNTQAAWLNPNAMTQRLNFATALASGKLPLSLEPPRETEQVDERSKAIPENEAKPLEYRELMSTLANGISTSTKASIEASPPRLQAALLLGSPDFMRR